MHLRWPELSHTFLLFASVELVCAEESPVVVRGGPADSVHAVWSVPLDVAGCPLGRKGFESSGHLESSWHPRVGNLEDTQSPPAALHDLRAAGGGDHVDSQGLL